MYKLNNPSPNHLGIHNEVVSDKVFHLRLVPLFIVKCTIILFNPDCPNGDATKKVPNLESLTNFL